MNESLRLELEMDDEPLPIQGLGEAGLELQHEIDACLGALCSLGENAYVS